MVDNYGIRAKTKLPFGLDGGLKKLVTLPLCRFHKCHQAVLYVTQHCQERISAKTFLSDARQPEVRPSPFLHALTLTNLYCCKAIYPRVSTKPLPNDAKSPLPVHVRRSKTLLLNVMNNEHSIKENLIT